MPKPADKSGASKPTDYKKEVLQCYTHEYKGPRWDHYNDWEPEYQDWEEVGKDLKRMIEKGKMLIQNGQPEDAIGIALLILEENGKTYDAEYMYEREDFDYDDMHCDDCIDLIRLAFGSSLLSDEKKLCIIDRLEEIGRMDIYHEYDGCDCLDSFIHETRDSLLSDDEYLAVLQRTFNRETTEWGRESAACDLWNFLIELKRVDEAIKFFRANSAINKLRICYVDWLIGEHREREAIALLDEGLPLVKSCPGIIRDWEERKLKIYEGLKDTPHVISISKKMFAESYDVIGYYHKLKKHVPSAQWPEFLAGLLKSRDFGKSATSPLAQIYHEEKMFDKLFNVLNSSQYDLLSGLKAYASCFNEQQQRTLIARLEPELSSMAEHQMGRKSYQELTAKLSKLKNCCSAGQEMALKLVAQFKRKYSNRPAMLEELGKLK